MSPNRKDGDHTLSRRGFLTCGAVATAAGLTASAGGWRAAWAASDTIQDQLTAIAGSSNALALRQSMAQLLLDPVLPTTAQNLLQSAGSTLTSFQKNLLKVIPIIARDTGVLQALALGTPLTNAQHASLAGIRADLHNNPAIQLLISNGAQLKASPQLATYINKVMVSSAQTFPAPTSLGDAALDAIVHDFAAVRETAAFSALANALMPLMASGSFFDFVRAQQPQVVATFIPADVLIGLLLPNDRDPPIADVVKAILEIIGGIAGYAAVLFLLPEEITAAILAGTILALISALSAIAVGFIDLFQAIDCDFDGDPNDPDDVPGIECTK